MSAEIGKEICWSPRLIGSAVRDLNTDIIYVVDGYTRATVFLYSLIKDSLQVGVDELMRNFECTANPLREVDTRKTDSGEFMTEDMEVYYEQIISKCKDEFRPVGLAHYNLS